MSAPALLRPTETEAGRLQAEYFRTELKLRLGRLPADATGEQVRSALLERRAIIGMLANLERSYPE